MATAYLILKPDECTIPEVSQLTKEYLNMEDGLIIMDTNGSEIQDNALEVQTTFFQGKFLITVPLLLFKNLHDFL